MALLLDIFYKINDKIRTPTEIQRRVEGIPKRANSQKEILHLSPAVSATIIFATEPKIVRFPAIVLTKANKHQKSSGLFNEGTE